MASDLAVALPIALSIFGYWQEWGSCTGPKSLDSKVEDLCGDLRLHLNKKCTAMLEIPIKSKMVNIGVGRSITPIDFSDMTKKSVKESYAACTKFWDKESRFTLEQYSRVLATTASTLYLLSESTGDNPDKQEFDAIAASEGVPSNIIAAVAENNNLDKLCEKHGGCSELPRAPGSPLTREDVKLVVSEALTATNNDARLIEEKISILTTQVGEIKNMMPKTVTPTPSAPLPKPTTPLSLLSEISFETGNTVYSAGDSCAKLVKRISSRLHPSKKVYIFAYADRRGTAEHNVRLSEARAQITAECIAQKTAVPLQSIEFFGEGVLQLNGDSLQQSRKAMIFLANQSR